MYIIGKKKKKKKKKKKGGSLLEGCVAEDKLLHGCPPLVFCACCIGY